MLLGKIPILDAICQEKTDINFSIQKFGYDLTDVVFECKVEIGETLISVALTKDLTEGAQKLDFLLKWSDVKDLISLNTDYRWYCIATSGNNLVSGIFQGKIEWK